MIEPLPPTAERPVADDPPPFLGTWPLVYLAVLLYLLCLLSLLAALSAAYRY